MHCRFVSTIAPHLAPSPSLCLPLSFPPLPLLLFCFPSLPYIFIPFTFLFVPPLLFPLNPLPSFIPFMWESVDITPTKIFNTAIARRCVLIHCLALKSVLCATCIVPMQLHFGKSEIIGKSTTLLFHSRSESNVQRLFINKRVNHIDSIRRASPIVWLDIHSVRCVTAMWRQ
jgi:hypothetical protein